jgi:hypothetical protein
MSAAALEALLEVDQQLDRVRLAHGSLTSAEEAMQLWSRFCTAAAARNLTSLKRIGEDYLTLQPFHPLVPGFNGTNAATVCLAIAQDWRAVEEAASRWIKADPTDPRARRHLVEARLKQFDVAGACAAFEDWERRSESDPVRRPESDPV